MLETEINKVNIGIVGGGLGGCRLLEEFLISNLVTVDFVVDVSLEAPAVVLARKHGIDTFYDIKAAAESHQVSYVFEATGVPKVLEILASVIAPERIINSQVALLLFDIINSSKKEVSHAILSDIQGIQEEIDNNNKSVSSLLGSFTQLASRLQILSYNAGIEAAKSGEHGKGFGVVAFTLKDASEEAKDISKMISNLNGESREILTSIGTSMAKLAS